MVTVATAGLLATAGLAAAQTVVGVSWNNFQEERWKTDEAAIKAVLDKAGAKYISTDAQSSADKQLTDVENLVHSRESLVVDVDPTRDRLLPAPDVQPGGPRGSRGGGSLPKESHRVRVFTTLARRPAAGAGQAA